VYGFLDLLSAIGGFQTAMIAIFGGIFSIFGGIIFDIDSVQESLKISKERKRSSVGFEINKTIK